jgi:hypothetical protein
MLDGIRSFIYFHTSRLHLDILTRLTGKGTRAKAYLQYFVLSINRQSRHPGLPAS